MYVLTTAGEVAEWRADAPATLGLVPTMGNLHAGHMALVAAARERCDRVIASIFVNPLQFGPEEDLASYPRSLDSDRQKLAEAGVDAVFAPAVDQMYPHGEHNATRVCVDSLTAMLCGARRPGHFDGVATVVAKLFNLIRPDAAFFGEKDYQQLLVIRRMVADLCMDVAIQGVATVREADGLALSSRNQYLNPEQRHNAPALVAALTEAGERLAAGERDFAALEADGRTRLAQAGFEPDYFEIRDAGLAAPSHATDVFRVLAAGTLGTARLIDNIGVSAAEKRGDL